MSSGTVLEDPPNFVSVCNQAGSVVGQGNPGAKREFLKIFGSNFKIFNRSLLFSTKKPYSLVSGIGLKENWLRNPETKRIYASAKVKFPIYLRFRGQRLKIIFGEPPYNLKTEERITEKMLKEAKPVIRRPSPLEEALKYAEAFNELTIVSKTQVTMRFGVSRARVCQMLNLLELDDTIKNYLLSIKDVKEHNYFTERKLRQIAIIKDPQEQIRKFGELVRNVRLELNSQID